MFEDTNQGSTQVPGQPAVNRQPPPDLPVVGELAQRDRSAPAGAEDILESIDHAPPSPAVSRPPSPLKPVVPPGGFSMPAMPAMPPAAKPESTEPFFQRYRKGIVLVTLIVVGGVALAGVGWYGYSLYFAREPLAPVAPPKGTIPTDGLNRSDLNINGNVSPNANANSNQAVPGNVATPPPPPLAAPVDSDLDNLSDEEEALYGTDPQKVDTDEDGLTDRDEVKVFSTEPTVADTDGDGFPDGEEVRNGYDPKGTGRLLRIDEQPE